MLHQACSCEGDICCRMDCGVKLWRTQVCILWKEEPQTKLFHHKISLFTFPFKKKKIKTYLQLENKHSKAIWLANFTTVYATNRQCILKYLREKRMRSCWSFFFPLASAFAGYLFSLLNALELTSFGLCFRKHYSVWFFFSFSLRKTGKIHLMVFV